MVLCRLWFRGWWETVGGDLHFVGGKEQGQECLRPDDTDGLKFGEVGVRCGRDHGGEVW